MRLPDIKSSKYKYVILHPNPQTGEILAEGFNTKIEVEGYLNGSSNPEACIPTMRLDFEKKVEYRLKCRKLIK